MNHATTDSSASTERIEREPAPRDPSIVPSRRRQPAATEAKDYRHAGETRKNIPPAKIAAEGPVPKVEKAKYAYSPHLPPRLRFDPIAKGDRLLELIAAAGMRALNRDESKELAAGVAVHEPWLEWAGKREEDAGRSFEVDPIALHIHERLSAQAICRMAARQDVQRDLFADPRQSYREAVQFYRHDMEWTNRLILGESAQVMASLGRRERLNGKVQMIYMDPPYGIKFASNFQPEILTRLAHDAKADKHLTREAETVRAYRDIWRLGKHSYLSYLRERLVVARELLKPCGSIFVQINDESCHLVRLVLDEVFGASNFVSQISFQTTSGFETKTIATLGDYLLLVCTRQRAAKGAEGLCRTASDTREGKRALGFLRGSQLPRSQGRREARARCPYRRGALLYKPRRPYRVKAQLPTTSTLRHDRAGLTGRLRLRIGRRTTPPGCGDWPVRTASMWPGTVSGTDGMQRTTHIRIARQHLDGHDYGQFHGAKTLCGTDQHQGRRALSSLGH